MITKHYAGDDSDVKVLMGGILGAFAGVTVDEYGDAGRRFVHDTPHPTNGRRFQDCGYRPMVELLRYLEANDFVTFIASGGDRDFMRPFADDIYGIPPERVIGSSNALRYDDDAAHAGLPRRARRVRRRPGEAGAHLEPHRAPSDLAGGNSNGDIPMLRFAGGPSPALRLLVLHDDAEREFDYTTGAETALQRAADEDWTVVSVKDDWSTVYHDVRARAACHRRRLRSSPAA